MEAIEGLPVLIRTDERKGWQLFLALGEGSDTSALFFDNGGISYGCVSGARSMVGGGFCGRSGLLSAAMKKKLSAKNFIPEHFAVPDDASRTKLIEQALEGGYLNVAVRLACDLGSEESARRLTEDRALPFVVRAALLPKLNDSAVFGKIRHEARMVMSGPSASEFDAFGVAATYTFMRGKIEPAEDDLLYKNRLEDDGVYRNLLASNMMPWVTKLAESRKSI